MGLCHTFRAYVGTIKENNKTVRSTAQYLRLTAEVYPDLMKKVEKSCAYVIPEVCHEKN